MLISGDSVSAGTFAKYLWSLLGDGLGTEKPWCCHVEQSDGKGIRKYLPSSSYECIACSWFFFNKKNQTNNKTKRTPPKKKTPPQNQPKERGREVEMAISNFI